MGLPVTIPALSVEIKALHLSDIEPVSESGYEIVLLKDLGYTKLWVEFRVVSS